MMPSIFWDAIFGVDSQNVDKKMRTKDDTDTQPKNRLGMVSVLTKRRADQTYVIFHVAKR